VRNSKCNVCHYILCVLLQDKVLLSHKDERTRSSSIVVQKLLLEGSCTNECVKQLKIFSLQLQEMTIEYTVCGFFTLNLKLLPVSLVPLFRML